eukprot:TRINITY_DN89737_c0_g1_i1.p1 TRINITY_DN89737_c0_g1~~TRINITY_DN89737_c0_g1_i1.p1  ORF type:complete len:273 (-),score=46.47 TRINITY_DN89737_c0_g1_i1:70-825(-)
MAGKAPPPTALAAFLGCEPSQAALRPGNGGTNLAAVSSTSPPLSWPDPKSMKQRPRRRADDSSPESDGAPPCYDDRIDLGLMNDANAPFSNPAPVFLRQFDEPNDFDCCRPKKPIAEIAPKRPKDKIRGMTASSSASKGSGGSVPPPRGRGSVAEPPPPMPQQGRVPPMPRPRGNSLGPAQVPGSYGFTETLRPGEVLPARGQQRIPSFAGKQVHGLGQQRSSSCGPGSQPSPTGSPTGYGEPRRRFGGRA